MDISVIPIGNSKGIRLSKTLIEKYNITDKVELLLEKDYIIIKPKSQPRKNWDKAFQKMHENGDDELFVEKFFVVLFQFAEKHFQVFAVVVAVCRNEEEQNRIAFYMPQEAMSEAASFSSPFDDSR